MAIDIYRKNFQPSKQLADPYVMACVNVVGADTDEEVAFQATTLIRMFLGIFTNTRSPLLPPGALPAGFQIPKVHAAVNNMLASTFTGNRDTLRKKLSQFIAETGIDELMAASYIYNDEAKLKFFSILYDALNWE